MKRILVATRGIHIIEYIYPLIKKLSKDFKVYLVIKTNQYSLSGENYFFSEKKIYKIKNKKKIDLYQFSQNVEILKAPEINKISIIYFIKLFIRKLRLVCAKYTNKFDDFFFVGDYQQLNPISKLVFFFYKKLNLKHQNKILNFFKKIENNFPTSNNHIKFIKLTNPNYVFVSPVNFQNRNFFLSPEIEFIKAAKNLNIKCGIYQLSWDNFNARGIIDYEPDQIFYWHDYSKIILNNLHNIQNSSLIKSGPMYFERLYNLKSSIKNKIDKENYILFFGSTDKVTDLNEEFNFINKLLNENFINKNKIKIYFKPHPSINIENAPLDFTNKSLKVISSGFAITNEEINTYKKLINSALIVCGVNTSAMFEAHILGRKVVCINFISKFVLPIHMKYIFDQNLFIVSNSYNHFIKMLHKIKTNKIGTFNSDKFSENLPSQIIYNRIKQLL